MNQPAPDLRSITAEEFSSMVEAYQRELLVHCYRMMGTIQDAQDMLQETLLRAWSRRSTYEGRASVRAWLYKIATNICLDTLKKHRRRGIPRTRGEAADLSQPIPADIHDPVWLEPFPDNLLATPDNIAEYVETRDQTRLAMLTALHLLPPRQRAVLLLIDVLDWHTHEVADQLNTTVSGVKSALHRARAAMSQTTQTDIHRFIQHSTSTDLSAEQLQAYMVAWENADIDAFVKMLTEDATFSMPPIPAWYQGRETIRGLVGKTVFAGSAAGRWRMLPTRANGQPAFGLYRITPDGTHLIYGIQVLTLAEGQISDVITFRIPNLVDKFGLPSAR